MFDLSILSLFAGYLWTDLGYKIFTSFNMDVLHILSSLIKSIIARDKLSCYFVRIYRLSKYLNLQFEINEVPKRDAMYICDKFSK